MGCAPCLKRNNSPKPATIQMLMSFPSSSAQTDSAQRAVMGTKPCRDPIAAAQPWCPEKTYNVCYSHCKLRADRWKPGRCQAEQRLPGEQLRVKAWCVSSHLRCVQLYLLTENTLGCTDPAPPCSFLANCRECCCHWKWSEYNSALVENTALEKKKPTSWD